MNKIGKNLIYQSSYQVLKILMPLITVPIVSHALGASGIGTYAFSNSITQYFVLITSLGLPLYGTREIAKTEDNKIELSQKFWTLEGFSLILTGIVLVFYFIVGYTFNLGSIFYIQSLLVLAAGLDVSWFFMGREDFKKLSLVNFSIQFISFLSIVTQINSSKDVIKYALILTLTTVIGSAVMWVLLKDKLVFIKPQGIKMWEALKGSAVLFVPQVAIVMYTNLNKTILGTMRDSAEVGVFSNAVMVTSVFITLIASIDTVLMPYATKLFTKKKHDEGYLMIQKVLNLEIFFTIAIAAGIIALSKKLIPWFFGSTFSGMWIVLAILSILVIVIPGGTTISRQFLIPLNRIKEYNNSVYFGAIISIFLNLLLIPVMGMIGAAIVSVTAESMIWIIRVIDFWKKTGLTYSIRQILLNSFSALIMILVIIISTNSLSPSMLTTIIQALIGIVVYMVMTFILKVNPMIDLLNNTKKKIIF